MNTDTATPLDAHPTRSVLALNSGSSSLKFGLYRIARRRIECLLSGEAEEIGKASCSFHAEDSATGSIVEERSPIANQSDAFFRIVRLLTEHKVPRPEAVGHRIVHGGPKLTRHCRIDKGVLETLGSAVAFAPLHMPEALSVIHLALRHFPGVPQVACFDTSFHSDMPDFASVLPLPRELREQGIRRYGFHGLSCESILHQLADDVPARLIIAHLGNGASVTAVVHGKSVDTSMGLTPTGGVIMGTRTGDLDPGVLTYLTRALRYDAARLEDLVDHRAGLLGISGLSADLRVLHRAAPTHPDAQLALEMFCYSTSKQLGAMAAVLGGVDLLVFTGGIGEHDAVVRARICSRLGLIGVSLDADRNLATADPISDHASPCRVRVMPSQEDEQIARTAWSMTRE